MFVCVSLNYSFIFAPIVTKFGHPVGLVGGSSMRAQIWGPRSPGTPGGQKCKTMLYCYQTWSKEPLMQAKDDVVVVTTTLHQTHIQNIIRCRVVELCIEVDMPFKLLKVHMSEKHKKLKVLTKTIMYPERLNALLSNISFKNSISGVFSTKYEL